jgi:hypothetical protein
LVNQERNFSSGFRSQGNGSLVEGLEEPHFGNGILFAAGQWAPIGKGPGIERGLLDKNSQTKGGLAIGRDCINEFPGGTVVIANAVYLIKTVLINVAICRGVTLHSANRIRACHGRIIEAAGGKVNESRTAKAPKVEWIRGKDSETELAIRFGAVRRSFLGNEGRGC